jgi:hypothetical protein
MKILVMGVMGWLVPGGALLAMRRYRQFAAFAALVTLTLAAGFALNGGAGWPHPADLEGLDSFSVLVARAGAVIRVLAGAPVLLASLAGAGSTYMAGRLQEYGTTLLTLAGLFNLLALASAWDLARELRK